MGVATGTVHIHGEPRMGDVQLRFGRVGEERGVLLARTAASSRPTSASRCIATRPAAASARAAAARW